MFSARCESRRPRATSKPQSACAAIAQVCRYAFATARAESDPTYALRGTVASPKVTHRAALTEWSSFGRLLNAIWTYEGQPETARAAAWSEFDISRPMWIIPAERAKMRREHRKPLPRLAVNLLQQLESITGGRDLAFESSLSPKKPPSENTFNQALRRMGFSASEATAHGFRASATSLLNECGLWTADAIEAELGHATGSTVRRAYHRAVYWEERIKMAEWWSGEISQRVPHTTRVESAPRP